MRLQQTRAAMRNEGCPSWALSTFANFGVEIARRHVGLAQPQVRAVTRRVTGPWRARASRSAAVVPPALRLPALVSRRLPWECGSWAARTLQLSRRPIGGHVPEGAALRDMQTRVPHHFNCAALASWSVPEYPFEPAVRLAHKSID